jgi:hypothetical protein
MSRKAARRRTVVVPYAGPTSVASSYLRGEATFNPDDFSWRTRRRWRKAPSVLEAGGGVPRADGSASKPLRQPSHFGYWLREGGSA